MMLLLLTDIPVLSSLISGLIKSLCICGLPSYKTATSFLHAGAYRGIAPDNKASSLILPLPAQMLTEAVTAVTAG